MFRTVEYESQEEFQNNFYLVLTTPMMQLQVNMKTANDCKTFPCNQQWQRKTLRCNFPWRLWYGMMRMFFYIFWQTHKNEFQRCRRLEEVLCFSLGFAYPLFLTKCSTVCHFSKTNKLHGKIDLFVAHEAFEAHFMFYFNLVSSDFTYAFTTSEVGMSKWRSVKHHLKKTTTFLHRTVPAPSYLHARVTRTFIPACTGYPQRATIKNYGMCLMCSRVTRRSQGIWDATHLQVTRVWGV